MKNIGQPITWWRKEGIECRDGDGDGDVMTLLKLTKNGERNDGRRLAANAIVGHTPVSAGVLAANLNDDHVDDHDDYHR